MVCDREPCWYMVPVPWPQKIRQQRTPHWANQALSPGELESVLRGTTLSPDDSWWELRSSGRHRAGSRKRGGQQRQMCRENQTGRTECGHCQACRFRFLSLMLHSCTGGSLKTLRVFPINSPFCLTWILFFWPRVFTKMWRSSWLLRCILPFLEMKKPKAWRW